MTLPKDKPMVGLFMPEILNARSNASQYLFSPLAHRMDGFHMEGTSWEHLGLGTPRSMLALVTFHPYLLNKVYNNKTE